MNRSGIEVMKRLLKLVKPLKSVMVLAVTMGVLGHLCAIAIPTLGAFVISGRNIKTICIILPIVAILRGVFHLLEQNRNHYLAFKLLALIRDEVFGALRKLAPAKLEGRDKGDLIALITSDIELLEVFYAHTISPIFIALIVSLIMSIFIGRYHALLGLMAALAYMVVGIVVPLLAAKHSKEFGAGLRKQFGDLDAFVLDSLRGIKESIQFNTGEERLKAMNDYSDSLQSHDKKLKGVSGTSMAITSGVILLIDAMFILVSVLLVENKQLEGNEAIIAVISLMSSFGPVSALASLGTGIQNTLAAGNRVLDILDEEPIVLEVANGNDIEYQGAQCTNINFAYEEEKILDDFSITIPSKGIIGLVGKSGSGKSTFLKLLMRFWDLNSGKIEISNEDIRKINTSALRETESFATQDTILFHDSIERNLTIANPKATHEQVVAACQKAAIHDFIMTLPNGYETSVSELGDNLSGGERQRLGLARVFLHDAPLILLDEPTSNLDSLNEAIILNSLKEYCENKAVVLVSHRKSTLCIAEKTYCVENGRMS